MRIQLWAAVLIMLPFWLFAQPDESLTVKVSKLGQARTKQIEYTGVISYHNETQIVTPVSGILTGLVSVNKPVYALGEMLYELRRNEPGYPDIRLNNTYKDKVVKNTFFEVGEFVEENKVILTMVDPYSFKTTINVMPDEVKNFRQSRKIDIKVLKHSNKLNFFTPDGIKIRAPLENKIYYQVDLYFTCQIQCGTSGFVGNAAVVELYLTDQTQYIPTRALQDGMSSVFVLDGNGLIAMKKIKLVEADENFAIIENKIKEKVVFEFNRTMRIGEKPTYIVEL